MIPKTNTTPTEAVVGAGVLGQEIICQRLRSLRDTADASGDGASANSAPPRPQLVLVSRNPRVAPDVLDRYGLPADAVGDVQMIAADARDHSAIQAALKSVDVIYHCANAPYHRWKQELPPIWDGILSAARACHARLVIASNLYAFGPQPLAAGQSFAPCSRKGRIRAELERRAMELHRNGGADVAIVRASDFFGPGAHESMLGARFFEPPLNGKPASLVGRMDMPHSYAYVPDFARTMIATAHTEDESVWGRDWIIPHDAPRTGAQLTALLKEAIPGASVSAMGKGMLRFGGLFVPAARELVEMYYEFDRPFVVDDSDTRESLGLDATPFERAFKETLAYYREERA